MENRDSSSRGWGYILWRGTEGKGRTEKKQKRVCQMKTINQRRGLKTKLFSGGGKKCGEKEKKSAKKKTHSKGG